MSVPDYRQIVAQVFATGGYTITTKAGAGLFVEAAARALHLLDAQWGHLRKPEGRTHVVDAQGNRHAVDVVLYRRTGQIVDIIRDAGEPGADLSWGEGREGEYDDGDWYAPVPTTRPPPVPVPVPVPQPTPTPTPQPVIEIDLGGVLRAVAALDAANELRYLDLCVRLDGLASMIAAVPTRYQLRIFGQTVTLEPQ
jgi:hypothetical protein